MLSRDHFTVTQEPDGFGNIDVRVELRFGALSKVSQMQQEHGAIDLIAVEVERIIHESYRMMYGEAKQELNEMRREVLMSLNMGADFSGIDGRFKKVLGLMSVPDKPVETESPSG